MSSVLELLLKTLDDLSTQKLQRLKWYLKNYESISTADIEKAKATDIVDIMVARFTPEGAVKITLDILRKMNENHLAEQLENKHKDVQNAVQISRDAHNVDPNPKSGVTVHAPVFTRNISNPVTFNPSSSSSAVGLVQYYNKTMKKVDPVVKFPSAGLISLSENAGDTGITLRQQYACVLTLDPNTAHPNLFLSERNRKATHVREKQPYPDHAQRFDWEPQVLSQESLTGRCYWEVEWSGRMGVGIVVTYKGTRSKGADNDYSFGRNTRSWQLKCSGFGYIAWHNGCPTNIPFPSSSTKVGVYVDVSAGTLSFYSVSDTHTLTHLHTFNTTFTEPLYAAFLIPTNCSVCLCEI
ncbi:stonustoxin subunit beta-like [Megalobrama amblycephala]|uniref:stonustoxin subunit beta-like n=1 Tax=Megalobrama amblycephala TaxID=75352 RepID=UPI0020142ABF|nr:stonustoxin subunit beta-like [Megalobrama amblycephala]